MFSFSKSKKKKDKNTSEVVDLVASSVVVAPYELRLDHIEIVSVEDYSTVVPCEAGLYSLVNFVVSDGPLKGTKGKFMCESAVRVEVIRTPHVPSKKEVAASFVLNNKYEVLLYSIALITAFAVTYHFAW